jgi:hypothetical protein
MFPHELSLLGFWLLKLNQNVSEINEEVEMREIIVFYY